MSTALEQRIVELETRLAFQEQALAELSDALAAARIEAAGHADLLQRTLEAMKQSRGGLYADPYEEQPQPPYCVATSAVGGGGQGGEGMCGSRGGAEH